mgnify:CR=1 FL=1
MAFIKINAWLAMEKKKFVRIVTVLGRSSNQHFVCMKDKITRRLFLRRTLPMLGSIVLIGCKQSAVLTETVLHATCKDCSNTCANTCRTQCAIGCTNGCISTCRYTCNYSGKCDHCSDICKGSCHGSCHATCQSLSTGSDTIKFKR